MIILYYVADMYMSEAPNLETPESDTVTPASNPLSNNFQDVDNLR